MSRWSTLADYEIPLSLPAASPKYAGAAYPRPDHMAELTARLEAADTFILVTPEHNHSYPASLKAAIDWHFTQWTAKPVAFVSYGGAAGGRHAVLHLEVTPRRCWINSPGGPPPSAQGAPERPTPQADMGDVRFRADGVRSGLSG